MNASPTLTCIITTYNRSSYVRECLRSVRESGVADLEVIVADDGSTDDTAEVVAQTDPSARYYWQANSGTPSTTRNAAFALSRGRYVAFLDCDDLWLPGMPAKAIAFLDRHPRIDALFADARMGNETQGYRSWIDVAGQEAFFRLPHQELEPGFRQLERLPFFLRMVYRNPVFIGAVILRREAFASSGGFDPQLCGAADWELWLRMALNHDWVFLNEPLAIYRRHDENLSSNHEQMIGEFAATLRCILARCELSAPDQAFVKQCLANQLFGHAYLAYDRGDYRTARQRFAEYLRTNGLNPRGLLLWTACCLPSPMTTGLRRLKQYLVGSRASS